MNTREQFGKYLLLKKLTEDPLGETFRAGMLGEGGMERVALLRVFNGQGVDGPRLWEATKNRAQIPRQLRNPNIGEGVEMGEIEGLPYVAYDYISGKNMANLLAQAARSRSYIPAEHALLITERVALALAAASESRLAGERILHGFVAPHLVMISNEGEARLLGFEVGPGLRTFAANPVIRQHFGRYLAPEALGGQPPHPADDIYSLGVLLYELLTGRPLPPPAPDGFAPIIEQGLVATEGTPLPGELQDLLKRSLVTREHRIGDVGSWHKTLNKLMFDGQYSPTTFNLAFFMHNLFRQEIEQESQEIEIEKTLPLPTVQQPPPAAPVTQPIRPLTATGERPEVDDGSGAVATVPPPAAAAAGPEVAAESEAPTAVPPEPKKTKTGLIAPAAAVLLLLLGGGWWWWTSRQEATARAATPPPPPVAVEPPVPAGPSEEELNQRIKELIEQQATAMEDELRKEYDQQLAELQSQLDRAKREAEARRRREAQREAERRRQEEEAAQAAEALAAAEAAEQAAAAEEAAAAEQAAAEQAAAEETAAEETAAEEAAALEEAPGGPEAAEPGADEEAVAAAAEPEPPPVVEEVTPPPEPEPPPPVRQVRRGDLVEMGPGVTPPKLVRRPTPRFPEQARRLNRREAKVLIRVLIDETGKVMKAEAIGERQGYGFDAEALSTAKRSVYSPATKDGVPVKIWHTLEVVFRNQ